MKDDKITICSVGDLMICDSPLYASVGVGSKYPQIRERLFENCKPIFEGADVVIGNFETVVYKPRNRSLKETQMCCPKTVIQDLKQVGFNVLNIANNHCMQHGAEGFENTRRTCLEAGIMPIGIRDEEPLVKEINGKKLVFLSVCIHLEWYDPEHIMYEDRIDRIIRSVMRLRKEEKDSILIVSAHWGDEFAKYPSNAQVALAHKLVECGANVILGHHSHVYQGIEEYQGGLILYGQGNFVSDMVPVMCRQTGIVTIQIDDSGNISHTLSPLSIAEDYQLVPTGDDWYAEREELLKKAVSKSYSDEEYWDAIKKNHAVGHGNFKTFFKHNLMKYHLGVSTRMIVEFLGRKFKRIVGTTTDGAVSSMDPAIMEALKAIDKEPK